MMNSETEDLQTVLTEMFASKDRLTLDDVGAWQKKYPHFSREIVEAYTDWRDFEFFVLEDEENSEIDELISEKDRNFLGNLLEQFQVPSAETITDLRETAAKKGVARETLPQMLGVSETLMRKIERRNLKEIPQWVEKKLAEIFRLPVESWRTFFALPSALPNAKFKSKNAPQTQPKQTFVEAVRNDPELTDDEKRELLKLE